MNFIFEKNKTNYNASDINIPAEFANVKCIYQITADNNIIYIDYSNNLFISLLDILRNMNYYKTEDILIRGLKSYIRSDSTVELSILDVDANYDKYQDYLMEYKPLLNNSSRHNFLRNYKIINKEQKSAIMNELGYSLDYLTGDDESVYYLDKTHQLYKVMRN